MTDDDLLAELEKAADDSERAWRRAGNAVDELAIPAVIAVHKLRDTAVALRARDTELATARQPYHFVSYHREELEAWLRGCEQGIWWPTAATQRVLASLLRTLLLASVSPPASGEDE